MMQDAEAHAEDDQRRREEADIRNNCDNLVYSIERTMKDVDGKVDVATKNNIEEALKDAKLALAGDDVEEIKRKQEVLLSASHVLSQQLYQQAEQEQETATATENPEDDLVEDAEVVDDEDETRRK
jgi:molecular chaperone DnaK